MIISEGCLEIIHGDALEVLRGADDGAVQCCVSSPPYWGLRDYGVEGQLGLEETPDRYVQRLVEIFREVRRALADDGTLWLNLGDSYARDARKGQHKVGDSGKQSYVYDKGGGRASSTADLGAIGLKAKDLVGIPWMVAFALRADGWYLRADIIWHKPNPMPESVTDRPTKAHEYIFLFSKSEKYFYDILATQEPAVGKNFHDVTGGNYAPPGQTEHTGARSWRGSTFTKGKTAVSQVDTQSEESRKNCSAAAAARSDNGRLVAGFQDRWDNGEQSEMRRKRDVWTVGSKPYKGAHFAVMPEKLVEPCILAGTRPGDTVLDPFCGSGTVGVVALRHGRKFVGIDLNSEYIGLANDRIAGAA